MSSNQTLLQKADMTLADLTANGGELLPEHGASFIRKLILTPTILKQARVVEMTASRRKINKIGFGSRILRKATSGVALTETQRAKATTYLVGTVTDKNGNSVTSTIETQEGYTLTAMTSVDLAKKIASGNFKPGFQTPSLAYGKDVICEVSGAQFEDK